MSLLDHRRQDLPNDFDRREQIQKLCITLAVSSVAGINELVETGESSCSSADSLTSDADGATAGFGTGRSPKQPRGDISARDPV